jgi:ketol-acid reductoisomerase
MNLLHDSDADLSHLAGSRIAVIGYGNQGRAQALNLRDSGLEVIIGNIADAYAGYARADGFAVHTIPEAVAQADVVMLLVPDEIMPALFDAEIAPHLKPGAAVDLASGYTVAFGQLAPPPTVDLILLAPRMIGAGVRDLYLAGQGFPAFFGVAQDASGSARDLVLALAKGIGATRMGVVEVTFAQEAELDLFTEQCFGPAFGAVLTASINLLIDAGYPPEAVLLELYMSGEFAYTLGKIAEMGLVEQAVLHSGTSQYGSMSRGMRFQLPELRAKLQEGLAEIRSGAFAREWAEEQAEGSPTLELLKEQARAMPLHALEQQLRAALGTAAAAPQVRPTATRRPLLPSLRALLNRGPSPAPNHKPLSPASGATPTPAQPPQPPAPSPSPPPQAPPRRRPGLLSPQPPAPSPSPPPNSRPRCAPSWSLPPKTQRFRPSPAGVIWTAITSSRAGRASIWASTRARSPAGSATRPPRPRSGSLSAAPPSTACSPTASTPRARLCPAISRLPARSASPSPSNACRKS